MSCFITSGVGVTSPLYSKGTNGTMTSISNETHKCITMTTNNSTVPTFGSMSSIAPSGGLFIADNHGGNISLANTAVTTTTAVIVSPSASACTTAATSSTPTTSSVKEIESSSQEEGSSHNDSTLSNPNKQERMSSSSSSQYDTTPYKRKHDDDSDTDTSESSPNKKRKPGRPRKTLPGKSSAGTETIWSKKTKNHQTSSESGSQPESKRTESDLNTPLFLDDEWSRRRSERIFLSDATPPAVTPSSGNNSSPGLMVPHVPVAAGPPSPKPAEQHNMWKLSNFMPKRPKPAEVPAASEEMKSETKIEVPSSHSASSSKKPSKSSEVCSKKVSVPSIKFDDRNESTSEEAAACMPLKTKSKRGRKPKLDNSKPKKNENKQSSESTLSSPTSSSPDKKKKPRDKGADKAKQQKAKNLQDLTQRVKKKFSRVRKSSDEMNGKGRSSKSSKRTNDTDSYDSESDPPTPQPRDSRLQSEDIFDNMTVLYLNEGHFYEATVTTMYPPDLYGVSTAGMRRPHILCLDQLLKACILDVHPRSKRFLRVGTRVCAFWSHQLKDCLYPGTVVKSPSNSADPKAVHVDFDDGDDGKIIIDHIRLLPRGFPIVEYEPDPLDLPKRRRLQHSDEENLKSKGEKKSTTSSDDNCEDDDGNLKFWQWHGGPIKQKGKLPPKGKRINYNAIKREQDILKVGDAAIFISPSGDDDDDSPYIGNIESLWETASGSMKVKVRWYYHPEETKVATKVYGELKDPVNALFSSTHMDENDVQTIKVPCEVLSQAQYKKLSKPVTPRTYFCAGHFDPYNRILTISSNL